MSNTATANLLMPIAVSVATVLTGLDEYGGLSLIVITVALSSAMGMALPISSPSNALAYGTGLLSTSDFIKIGQSVSIIGLMIVLAVMAGLGTLGYF